MAQRYDTFVLQATKTDEGFIQDNPVVGRVGILKYVNADGSPRFEYRPPDEAFHADSLATLKGKPITLGHHGLVTAANVTGMKPVGTVLSAGRQDGDNIRAEVMIYNLPTDARELSCGYTCDLDETPGTTPQGEHYDAVQRHIRYNHVAVVKRGRAGHVARLNMDGDEDWHEDKGGNEPMTMVKVRLDSGIDYDAAPEVKNAYEKALSDIKDGKKREDALQAKYDTLLADSEKAKKEHEEAAKKQKEHFDAAVKSRVAMLDVAKKFKVEKADELTDKEIKLAVIKAVHGDALDMTGKSDEYIDACYDMAKAQNVAHEDGMAKQRQQVNSGHEDGGKDNKTLTLAERMEKMREDEAALYLKEVK